MFQPPRWRSVAAHLAAPAIFIAVAAAYLHSTRLPNPFADGPFHHQLAQADAFWHGRLHLESPPEGVELAHRDGKAYVAQPPGPAVILIPLVAIRGSTWNIVAFHIVLSAISTALLYGVFRHRGVSFFPAIVGIIAFALGTMLWWCSHQTGAWHTSHVVAVLFVVLALFVAHRWRAAATVGFLIGFAALCRQLTLLAAPYFLYLVLLERSDKNARSALWTTARFAIGAALPIGFYMMLNYARFGDPLESGYRYINLRPPGLDKYLAHGLFSAAYLPENLFTLLFAAPRWRNTYPYIVPDFFGQALIFTSPFVLYAFRATVRSRENVLIWFCVLAILIPQLLYFNNGYAQFGYRFALDFLPLLMLLVVEGFGKRPSAGACATVAIAVAMNQIGVWML